MSLVHCQCPGVIVHGEFIASPCDEAATQEDFLCNWCREDNECVGLAREREVARERVSQAPA